MAKKPHTHLKLSDYRCTHPGCKRRIKANVVERKEKVPRLCYKHYWLLHPQRSNRAYR